MCYGFCMYLFSWKVMSACFKDYNFGIKYFMFSVCIAGSFIQKSENLRSHFWEKVWINRHTNGQTNGHTDQQS